MSWASDIYTIDKRGAELCRDMSIAGFAFDAQEAKIASAQMLEVEGRAFAEAELAVGRTIRKGNGGGFSTIDLGQAFYKDLRAPVLLRSEKTGAPSLGVDALRSFAACARPELRALSVAVLEWRRARKIRSTYIDAIKLGSDLRVHPTWLNYGTVSGRFSCQQPNIMNLPRPENDPTRSELRPGGIRGLFHAKRDHVLVAGDAKQLEMRIAAYASGDKMMIAACESSDLHAANAAVIFGDLFNSASPPLRKALRTLAKSAGFAVCYLAEAETVWARIVATPEGAKTKLREVKSMLEKLRNGFADYFRWQNAGLLDAMRNGYVSSPVFGRRRWLGHDPSPTEAANFPIQSGAADLMNDRAPKIVFALRAARLPAKLVAQVHDSCVFECERSAAPELCALFEREFTKPIDICTSGTRLTASFPLDLEISDRWH